MDMIDTEIMRLKNRLTELSSTIIPDFEHKTQVLYAQIMTLDKGSEEREKHEDEYTRLSKELTLRSDEIIRIRHEIENLELEKNLRR